MAREVAVFIDNNGLTGTFGEPGRVRVYRRRQKAWTVARETDFTLTAEGGLKGLRRQMAALLAFLGECRTFVARSLTGMPYYELEKAGFNVWEQSGEPLAYLEEVWAGEEREKAEKNAPAPAAAPLGPTEKAPGHYFISLKEIQARNAGITTKHVLQPFLRRGRFNLLEVVCDHLPPWLELDLTTGAFTWTSEKISERETRIIIKADGAGGMGDGHAFAGQGGLCC
ncbi:Fe-only nitrogenase accessory AnfO family protein [Anaeroselena agilis]|uniref:Fe-only nitrogenase accessory AnfO family protein n=1 Tax=Anaeroselena agilis TaxID=3063788 RepID=A0ABU3NZD4_9FIRM|nr:Fe-only nitrogenase accessory AnfO family protein [Selenomonadales bacterium 4137-cl]